MSRYHTIFVCLFDMENVRVKVLNLKHRKHFGAKMLWYSIWDDE